MEVDSGLAGEFDAEFSKLSLKRANELMIDFHLGNAINLDLIKILMGDGLKYNHYMPRFLPQAWNQIMKYRRSSYDLKLGTVGLFHRLYLDGPLGNVILGPTLWKDLVKLVAQSLEQKGIDIPITRASYDLESFNVNVPGKYIVPFDKTLAVISSLSEVMRGGDPVYTSVIYDSRTECLSTWIVPEMEIDVVLNRNICMFSDHANRVHYVGNYDTLLLFLDTLGQRICAYIGSEVSRACGTLGHIPSSTLTTILETGDHILNLCGNAGYEIIAMFESLVVSTLLVKSEDEISDRTLFRRSCLEELEELILTAPDPPLCRDLIQVWLGELESARADELSNIFCLYRVWGHPEVDIHAGMQKVHAKAMAEKNTVNYSRDIVLFQFRHMFLSNFLRKNKSYPQLHFAEDCPESYVLDQIKTGSYVNAADLRFSLDDYRYVEIGQIWRVPETYDVCHILNDKAVSPTRRELYESIRMGGGTLFNDKRRGLIRWMEKESIRCNAFLQHIDENGLDEEDLIIGMYEKEREIKVKARMFSLMSENMRMYVVLTEELIANHILPYFPEITMKDPMNVQTRKIWKVGGVGQNSLNPNINIDFEKWNLNMRAAFTDGLFRQMDIMFGYSNLIARTHSFFENSLVYSASGKYLPKLAGGGFVQDVPMCYIGHKGGFEGLRQKGWTIATVVMLAYTAFTMKIEMQLLGQGDNQIAKLYMPVRKWDGLLYTREARINEAKEITTEFVRRMTANFVDAGLPIKVRETWISTKLFMYGKRMYFDGAHLPQWLKKTLRSYALSNEGTVTISGVIGTIATNMQAAAGESDSPDIMYLLYLILGEWSLDYLITYHPFTRERIIPGQSYPFKIPGSRIKYEATRVSLNRLKATILMIPTAIGGGVTITLPGFIIRGFPDHASEGYAWVKMLMSVGSRYQDMFRNWYTFLRNHSIELDMLVQSPWSLNHLKPPTPGLQSRELVRDWLLSGRFQRNRFIRQMRVINSYFNRKMICQQLVTDPMNPLVTNEVYKAFPHVQFDDVLRRFEGTRSVRKLAFKENTSMDIVSSLIDVEKTHWRYLYWRGTMRGELLSECATEQARLARNVGWGRVIHGLTTPHPLEFLFDEVCIGSSPRCTGHDYIHARKDQDGKYPPFLGSRVRTKVTSLQDERVRGEPLVCSNARLARYLRWLSAGENLISVIKMSTEVFCDTSVFDNFYDEDESTIGFSGCVEHRFNPAGASNGCFINYSPHVGSTVYMSNDNLPTYGKGQANYTIHFQALMCFLQYITAKRVGWDSRHYHLNCAGCIVPCDDTIGDISADHPAIDIAFNPYAIEALRDVMGRITEAQAPLITPKDMARSPYEIEAVDEQIPRRAIYGGALTLLGLRCALEIFVNSQGSTDMMNLEDLQSYPRVYAYKVLAEDIITSTREFLIYIFVLRLDMGINYSSLSRAKTELSRFLDTAPLTNFRGLASLCIGRNTRRQELEFKLPTGQFPDTTEAFLRAVKSLLISQVKEFVDFSPWTSKSVYLPRMDLKDREFQIIISYILTRDKVCYLCAKKIWEERDSPTPSNWRCRECHFITAAAKCPLYRRSFDNFFKLLKAKQSSRRAYEKTIIPDTMIRIMEPKSYPEVNFSDVQTRRKINLPTASIYKWQSVLGALHYDPDIVIVIGDGTGGTSMISAYKWPGAKILPMSKFEIHKVIPQDEGSLRPFLSRDLKNVSHDFIMNCPDDIWNPQWAEKLVEEIRKSEGTKLIISDIECVDQERLFGQVEIVARETSSDYIIKGYLEDLPALEPDAIMFTSYHANSMYKELFVTTIPKHLIRFGSQTKSEVFENQMRVEMVFSEYCRLSLYLARQKISTCGISFSDRIVTASPRRVVMSLIRHMNTRYRFPKERLSDHDNRNLYDGILLKLNVIAKIIILGVSNDESVMSLPWFESLTWISPSKEIVKKTKVSIAKIVLASSPDFLVPLTREEVLCARTIRNNRHMFHTYRSASEVMADYNKHRNNDAEDMCEQMSIGSEHTE